MPDTTYQDEIATLQAALALAKALRLSASDELARMTEQFDAVFRDGLMGVAISHDSRCERVLSNATLDALLTPSFRWADPPLRQDFPVRSAGPPVELLTNGKALNPAELPLWRAAALGERVGPTEIEIRVAGRAPRRVLASATPLRQADGRSRGGIVSMVEIARGANHAAQVVSRVKDEFLALLGHELRNPLNAIATAVEVLNRAPPDAPVAVSARRIIGSQTRHLAGLMDRLLDVGHVLTDAVVLSRKPMNLSASTQKMVAAVQADAGAKSQTLRLHHLTPADAWISADADRIEQVLLQLLTNAVKYTPSGGRIEVELGLELGNDGAMVLLRVMDDGSIEPALLERIFDPFVQGERGLSRQDGGLGLGLTLVRRLVELHGGSVVARSSDAGSVFDVRLPSTLAPGRAEPVPLRLLLVEDNLDALSTLLAMLEFEGHQVQTATDGIDGLRKLLASPPEVAILDIGLPGIDGYEIAKGARAAGFTGRLIALTGYGQERDAQLAYAAGFDAHLIKPAETQVLLGLIQA